jgi:hypothetical protein
MLRRYLQPYFESMGEDAMYDLLHITPSSLPMSVRRVATFSCFLLQDEVVAT